MLPTISRAVIETATVEWFKERTDPFTFCMEQIKYYRDANPELLLAIDELLASTFVESESLEIPEEIKELNRAKAFSVVLFAMKVINNQLEVDRLEEMYD